MTDERSAEGEEEGAEALEELDDEYQITTPEGRGNYCTSEDCKWSAWRLYAEGTFAFKALARAVNNQHHADHPNCPAGPHGVQWAQRAVDYCGRATREALDRGGDVALAVLLQGYQADQQAQLVFATQGMANVKCKVEHYGENGKRTLTEEKVVQVPDNFLRSLARSRVTDIRAKQAAAVGVVTERKGQELTGPKGGPLDVNVNHEMPANGQLAIFLRNAAGIAERVAGLGFDACATGEDGPDSVGDTVPTDG